MKIIISQKSKIMRMRGFFSTSAETDVVFILPNKLLPESVFRLQNESCHLLNFEKSCASDAFSVLQLKRILPSFYPHITA